jgi:hypothetical protein
MWMPNTNSKRKFFAKLKLVEHLVNVHEEAYDIKIMYRKRVEAKKIIKKWSFDESESDGFVEILDEEVLEGEEVDVTGLRGIFDNFYT